MQSTSPLSWIPRRADIAEHCMVGKMLAQDGQPFVKFLRRHRVHVVRLQEERFGRLFLNLVAR
jgi:hypothetical protein